MVEEVPDELVLEISRRLDLASTFSFSLASKRYRSLLKSFDINGYEFTEICAENNYEDLLLWAFNMGCRLKWSVPDLLAVSGGPKSLEIISKSEGKMYAYITVDLFYKMIFNGNKTALIVDDSMLKYRSESPLKAPLRLAEEAASGGQLEMANLFFEKYLIAKDQSVNVAEAKKRLLDAFSKSGPLEALRLFSQDPSSGPSRDEITSIFNIALEYKYIDGIKLGLGIGLRPTERQIKKLIGDGALDCLLLCGLTDDHLREFVKLEKKEILVKGNYKFIKYLVEKKALVGLTRGDLERSLMDNEGFKWASFRSPESHDIRFEALKYLTEQFNIDWSGFDFYLSKHGWLDGNSFLWLISRGATVADSRPDPDEILSRAYYDSDRYFSLLKSWAKIYYSSNCHFTDKIKTTFNVARLMNAALFRHCVELCEINDVVLSIQNRNISELLIDINCSHSLFLVSETIKTLRFLLEKGARWDDADMQKHVKGGHRYDKMSKHYRAQLELLRSEFRK